MSVWQPQLLPIEPVGERRQLTVLFCDLVGSTELVASADPEDASDLIAAYHRACAAAIEARGGYVAQYLGDGVLAFFGYPQAEESAAENAVAAGLDAIAGVGALSWQGRPLAARVGVATGMTVVRPADPGSADEMFVTGAALNLASRIQTMVGRDAVGIAEATHALVRDRFDCDDLGAHVLHGFAGAVRVWRAVGARAPSRLRLAGPAGPALIGRGDELDRLRAAWRESAAGNPRAVIIRGEAGIGKSHLARALREEVRAGVTTFTLQCSPLHRLTPAYPFAAYLDHVAGTGEGRTERVLTFLGSDDDARQLVALLLPGSGGPGDVTLPAGERMTVLRDVLARQFTRVAGERPILLIVEDVQWADPTTIALVQHLRVALAGLPVMLLVTHRGDAPPAIALGEEAIDLALTGLAPAPHREMVERVAAGRLAADVVAEVIARSDGNPFYTAEMTLAAIEAGDDAGASRVPAALFDGVAARLDRLGDAKRLAQYASAIGRRFRLDMLARLTGEDEAGVRAKLARLAEAGIVVPLSEAQDVFQFRHALFQEVAYATLVRTRRRALHAGIAAELEAAPDVKARAEAETIAFHWFAADDALRAVPHWLAAGRHALQQGANHEATAHFRRGLGVLNASAPDADSPRRAFDLNLGLGQACYVALGPAHAETVAAFTRAQALVEAVGDGDDRAMLLYGMFSAYHFASKGQLAEGPAHRTLWLAQRSGSRRHACLAHRMLGYVAFFRGDAVATRLNFDRAATLYDIEADPPLAARYGADALSATQAFASVLDALAGFGDDGVARIERSIAHARATGHTASIGWSLAARGYVHFLRGDMAETARVAAEGIAFCEAKQIGSWLFHCRIFAFAAQPEADPQDIARLIDDAGAGNKLGLPLFRSVLADAWIRAGDPGAALAQQTRGLSEIADNGQHVFEAYLLYRRAQTLLGIGRRDAAIEGLFAALVCAQRTGTGLVSVRAAQALDTLVPAQAMRVARHLGHLSSALRPQLPAAIRSALDG